MPRSNKLKRTSDFPSRTASLPFRCSLANRSDSQGHGHSANIFGSDAPVRRRLRSSPPNLGGDTPPGPCESCASRPRSRFQKPYPGSAGSRRHPRRWRQFSRSHIVDFKCCVSANSAPVICHAWHVDRSLFRTSLAWCSILHSRVVKKLGPPVTAARLMGWKREWAAISVDVEKARFQARASAGQDVWLLGQ